MACRALVNSPYVERTELISDLVILNAAKNLALYRAVAPFLYARATLEKGGNLGADGRDSSLRSE